MKRTGTVLLSPLTLLTLIACGDDDGPTVSYSDWAVEQRAQVDTVCDCYQELGFDSRSECVSGQERIGPSQEDCARDAISADAEASRTFAACLLPLQRNFSMCIDERLDCSELDSLDPCSEDFRVGMRECDAFSPGVTRELESCGVEFSSLEVNGGLCSDTCNFADDGECDDGGPDAEFQECELGTDCTDCGPR